MQDGLSLEMNQDYLVKKAVACRTPASFVATVGRCVMNEAGDCKKRKDGFIVKASEFCPGELDFIPVCALELLCDTSQSL